MMLALMYNKYADEKVIYKIYGKNSMIYFDKMGCENVYKLFNQALEAYTELNEEDSDEYYRQDFPLPCLVKDPWNRCVQRGNKIKAYDVTAENYQAITSAQNIDTGLWNYKFLKQLFGIEESFFADAQDLCDVESNKRLQNHKRKLRKAKKAALKKKWAAKIAEEPEKAENCKNDIPTQAAIALLYGKFGDSLDDWRSSARFGIGSMKQVEKEVVAEVIKNWVLQMLLH